MLGKGHLELEGRQRGVVVRFRLVLAGQLRTHPGQCANRRQYDTRYSHAFLPKYSVSAATGSTRETRTRSYSQPGSRDFTSRLSISSAMISAVNSSFDGAAP